MTLMVDKVTLMVYKTTLTACLIRLKAGSEAKKLEGRQIELEGQNNGS